MDININIQEITSAVRDIFLKELPSIPAEKINNKSDGMLSEDELERSLVKADSAMRLALDRFITSEFPEDYASEYAHALPDYLIYTFENARRIFGREDTVSGLIFDALVSMVMGNIMNSLNPESAEIYNTAADEQISDLITLLFMKKRPTPRFTNHNENY